MYLECSVMAVLNFVNGPINTYHVCGIESITYRIWKHFVHMYVINPC
jgi:hypothetical protein